MKRKALILRTGNSSRMQMAEAIVDDRPRDRWEGFSAGTHPAELVHPYGLKALAEIGIKHEGRSKSAMEFDDHVFDLVITVCDSAAEKCPIRLGNEGKVYQGFPDPAKTEGLEAGVMEAFHNVRDSVAREIPEILARVDEELSDERQVDE